MILSNRPRSGALRNMLAITASVIKAPGILDHLFGMESYSLFDLFLEGFHEFAEPKLEEKAVVRIIIILTPAS